VSGQKQYKPYWAEQEESTNRFSAGYEIKTSVKDEVIFSEVVSHLGSIRENITMLVMNTQEEEIKKQLIKLGWTPPKGKKDNILYRLARLIRNTDGLHPSTWGNQAGQLLVELRGIDEERYNSEVMGAGS